MWSFKTLLIWGPKQNKYFDSHQLRTRKRESGKDERKRHSDKIPPGYDGIMKRPLYVPIQQHRTASADHYRTSV